MHDSLIPFVFDSLPIMGKLVSIDSSWQDIITDKSYDEELSRYIGLTTTANILLASTLKFTGSIQITLESNDALQFLVTECRHDLSMRAMAKRRSTDPLPSLSCCKLGITLDVKSNQQKYQSLVPTSSDSFNRAFEHYLTHSEQIPSLVRLEKTESGFFGILIQKMPALGNADEHSDFDETNLKKTWNNISHSILRCENKLLQNPSVETIIEYLFPEDDIKILPDRKITMRCNCSRERVGSLITSLGKAEAEEILKEEGIIRITCEFCGSSQEFDAVDTTQLFLNTEQSN